MIENIEARPSSDGKNCTYRVCLSYTVNGRLYKHTKSFSSKKYGSKKMALEIAKDYRDKKRIDLERQPAQGCCLDDLMKLKEDTIAHTVATNDLHRTFYNRYIKPLTGNADIRNVTAVDVQKTLNAMVSTKPQGTINRLYSVWRQLYKTAIMHSLCEADVTLKVIVPKSDIIPKHRNTTTSLTELAQVCACLYEKMINKRTAVLIGHALYIMYYTGIRPQEVYALSRDDINPIERSIRIRKSVGSNSHAKGVLVPTKTPQSVRTVYYPPQLDEVVSDLLENTTGALLFETPDGLITGRYASYCIKRLRPSGSKFVQYDLRHQFATDLIKGGADVRTVQELLGHASPVMSVGYARSNEESKREAVKGRTSQN